MLDFIVYCGLAFAAAVLLVSGVDHALRPGRFARLLGEHRVLPGRLTTRGMAACLGIGLAALELLVSGLALYAMTTGGRSLRSVALAGSVALGLGFVAYLRQLAVGGRDVDCGCSPFAGRLTPWSFVPGASLVVLGALGLVATQLGSGSASTDTWALTLAAGWGMALAGVTMLLPAAASGNAPLVRPIDPVHGGTFR